MYIFVDVETNGIGTFRPPTQTITQLSFIKTDKLGNIICKYSNLIKGAVELADIPQVIFTLEQLDKDGISLNQALCDLKIAMEDEPIFIAHNAEFDFSIIKRDAELLSIPIKFKKYFCTMKNSIDFCKLKSDKNINYKWPKLSELAEKLEIKYDESKLHDSSEDVRILKECFFKNITFYN
jgi:DNA polymerase III alpha subunit (gram-positive type)